MNDPRPARLTAADFHPEVLKLFDQYVHGLLDRRGFLDQAGRYAAVAGMDPTHTHSVETRLLWDTRDTPITPSRGQSGEFFFETSGGVLGDNASINNDAPMLFYGCDIRCNLDISAVASDHSMLFQVRGNTGSGKRTTVRLIGCSLINTSMDAANKVHSFFNQTVTSDTGYIYARQCIFWHRQTKRADAAPIGLCQTEAHAQRGGFAGAVGADDAQAFTGCDAERHIVHHRVLAIALEEVVAFEKWGAHAAILPA